MTNTQLALLLSKYEAQLDLCIDLARSELAAIEANAGKKGVVGLVDHKQDGFREPKDSPVVPALKPFEELSSQFAEDIKILIQE